MEDLTKELESKGYFESPSSTKWHGNYTGGLADHSWNVYKLFSEHCAKFSLLPTKISMDNIIIISLLHDACKVGAYIQEGKLITYNKSMQPGHASISLKRIQQFIKLEPIEEQCIKFHMGMYGAHETDLMNTEYQFSSLLQAFNNPIVKLFYFCDDMAAQLVDEQR